MLQCLVAFHSGQREGGALPKRVTTVALLDLVRRNRFARPCSVCVVVDVLGVGVTSSSNELLCVAERGGGAFG